MVTERCRGYVVVVVDHCTKPIKLPRQAIITSTRQLFVPKSFIRALAFLQLLKWRTLDEQVAEATGLTHETIVKLDITRSRQVWHMGKLSYHYSSRVASFTPCWLRWRL